MIRYSIIKALAKRILSSLLLLFLLITFLFFLVRLAPGNPAQKYIGADLSPELNKRVSEQFKLDKPVGEQYITFLINLSSGQLGVSYNYGRPVTEVIAEFLPFTIFLAFISLLFQLSAGYSAALFVFRRNKKFLDRSASVSSLILYSTPTFIIGITLILIFSEFLGLLPSSGLKSITGQALSITQQIWDYTKHMILPVITLSVGGAALFYNYIKSNLDEVSAKPFVLNLYANGFSRKEINKKHIVPNALGPVISAAGIEFGMLLGGALITEIIFSLPGMGRLTVNAILSRDYPLIIGCVFFAGCMVIISNLLADFIKAKIDKRLLIEGILN